MPTLCEDPRRKDRDLRNEFKPTEDHYWDALEGIDTSAFTEDDD